MQIDPSDEVTLAAQVADYIREHPEIIKVGGRQKGSRYVHVTVSVLLHRLLLNAPKESEVDHINGDGLDNRRSNLRLATRAQNAANTIVRKRHSTKPSRFRGVHWAPRGLAGYWVAQIRIEGKFRHLGYCKDEEQAARLYDDAAFEAHGEFATLNFPVERHMKSKHGAAPSA